jgi:hypothetical protein
VASSADEYRRRAQRCLELARTFEDPNARETLTHMAQAWLRLAERPDRWMLPTASKQTLPVVQQQQQLQPKKDKSAK